MKTLPLVDRNLFSYSFIPDLPLSLKEYLYRKTQRTLWNLPRPMSCVRNAWTPQSGGSYRKFLPRLNSAFSLLSSRMV